MQEELKLDKEGAGEKYSIEPLHRFLLELNPFFNPQMFFGFYLNREFELPNLVASKCTM